MTFEPSGSVNVSRGASPFACRTVSLSTVSLSNTTNAPPAAISIGTSTAAALDMSLRVKTVLRFDSTAAGRPAMRYSDSGVAEIDGASRISGVSSAPEIPREPMSLRKFSVSFASGVDVSGQGIHPCAGVFVKGKAAVATGPVINQGVAQGMDIACIGCIQRQCA